MSRLKIILTLLVLSVSCFATDYTCSLPLRPLEDHGAYSCDNSDQQPIWYVIYDSGNILVYLAEPIREVADVDASPNYYGEFYATSKPWPFLSVTLSKDSSGQWIEMNGGK